MFGGKGRIHWLDFLLGLVLLILVVRTVVNAWPRFDRKEMQTVRLEVVVRDLATDLAAQLAVGQWVKDGTTGVFMGKIIGKVTSFGTAKMDRPFGEFAQHGFGAEQDLVLVLEREGNIVEREGVFFGREPIRSGQERIFHTFYVEFPGMINRIVVVKEGAR